MATADRLNQVIGYLLKIEANPNVAETLSNSQDGLNPYLPEGAPEPPEPLSYVYDGGLGRAASNLLPQAGTTPNGLFRESQLPVVFKGSGATYSISVFPPNEVHRLMQVAGFDAAFGSSSWTYTPTAHGTTYSTGTLREFRQGGQYDQAGVIADWSFETNGLGVPIHTFAWKGVASVPTDVSLPSITLQATGVIPPVASAVLGTLGSFSTPTIRRVAFRCNRDVDTARLAMNTAGGHAGFVPGGLNPELEVEIERPARATFNPESLMAAATSQACSVQFGSAQWNNWKVDLPTTQIKSVVPGSDGNLATVVLTYRVTNTFSVIFA